MTMDISSRVVVFAVHPSNSGWMRVVVEKVKVKSSSAGIQDDDEA